MNDKTKKLQIQTDQRILKTEFNIHRACAFGSRSNRDERIIQYRTPEGLVEESRISPILYNGKLRTLNIQQGKLWNVFELLFREQGKLSHNRVYYTSAHLYDYLTDLSAIRNPKKHTYKDGSHIRDWLNENLHVMQNVSISKKCWRTKSGSIYSKAAKHLIKDYFIYQHDKKNDPKNTHNGLSWVELDDEIANSIRDGNVQPIFYETQNAIKNDLAAIFYPQLTSLLYKDLVYEESVDDVSKRFALNIKSRKNLLKQLRIAGKSLVSLLIPYGRKEDAKITDYKVAKKERTWFFRITAEKVKKEISVNIQPPSPILDPETKKMLDREAEMLKRYQELTSEEQDRLEPEVMRIKRETYDGFRRSAAIADAVENMFLRKSKEIVEHTENGNGFHLEIQKQEITSFGDSARGKGALYGCSNDYLKLTDEEALFLEELRKVVNDALGLGVPINETVIS